MKSLLRKKLKDSLPAYLNQTLGAPDRLMISLWLRVDATARAEVDQLQRLRDAIGLSARRDVPEGVLERVRQQVHQEASAVTGNTQRVERRRLSPGLTLAMVVLFALLAGAIVWFVSPPVISLEWSVSAGQPSEFRVYRARLDDAVDTDSVDFILLNEMPADSTGALYQYADLKIMPGQRYLYRVDALDVSGAIVRSNTTLGDSLGALPGQLVLLVASLLLLYGFAEFAIHGRNLGRWGNNDRGILR